jgi:hypothetical protein
VTLTSEPLPVASRSKQLVIIRAILSSHMRFGSEVIEGKASALQPCRVAYPQHQHHQHHHQQEQEQEQESKVHDNVKAR